MSDDHSMMKLEVGGSWPYRVQEGMTAMMDPVEGGLSLMLVCAMAHPSRDETRLLRKGKLRFAITPSPPLVWLVAAFDGLSYDAPYAPGLGGSQRADEMRRAANEVAGGPPDQRRLVELVGVDTSDRRIVALRAVSCSGEWWRALAAGIAASAEPVEQSAYQAALSRDMLRWPSTDALMRSAAATEIAGAI